ncbi:DUF2141 domain-containing protein [Polaribacter sp. HL-MS24]|uniref:DUF2141 domain-containing protein n=1 Tax=Polaribacter sp. HL-MS24 TaxID=3077735 RepID=UPI0029352388|nr:DUF2141 domain-containing protein [Polaribacter sp. HL-MS24]WOC39658.1 DUF2141 domain-containing protein [Polaribacter sp. HL-MS24]
MKKTFYILLFLFGGFISLKAQEKTTTFTLTANFSGMNSDMGKLFVAIYTTDSTFLKKNYRGKIVTIQDRQAVAIFENLPKGDYALSSFHDENNNQKMDTNFFGIPKEPLGMSNNAKGFMGPPKFKDAKFMLEADTSIAITVN